MRSEALTRLTDTTTTDEVLAAIHAAPAVSLRDDDGVEYDVVGGADKALLVSPNGGARRPPARLGLRMLNASFALEASGSAQQAHGLQLDGLNVYSSNGRSDPRWRAQTPTEARISLRGQHTIADVLDVSGNGLGLSVKDNSAHWRADELVNVSFNTEAKKIEGAARLIRGHGKRDDKLAFNFAPQVDNSDLMQALLSMRFPQQRPRATVDSSSVESLMINSGYAVLREGQAIDASWLSLSVPRVSIDRVYVDRAGDAIGHISITRSYRRTWIAHQLATLKGSPETFDCRLSIYQMAMYMIPLLTEGDDGYVMAYFDQAKPWHRHFFESFVRWMGNADDSTIADLDRFEAVSRNAIPLVALPSFVEISEAREEEIPKLVSIVKKNLPPLTARTLDINQDLLRTSVLHPDYVGSGLERSRDILVLRMHGRPIGAALLERGTGLSLFGLFDMAQFYFDPAGDIPVAARLQLIERARAWYRERGIINPMLVTPKGSLARDAHKRLKWVETMGLISLSARAMRHYENFLEFTTRWALLKKQLQRAD